MSAALWILLSWISLGLLAIAFGPRLVPRQSMGAILLTALIGLAGYLVGGALASLAGMASERSLSTSAMLLALGAMFILLFAYRHLRKA